MAWRYLVFIIPILAMTQTACKVVNTHTFKVTGSISADSNHIYIPTQKMQLVLASTALSANQIKTLTNLKTRECLDITSPEPFKKEGNVVRFSDFKFTKVATSAKKCKKIKSNFLISVR